MGPKAKARTGKEIYKPPTKRALPFDEPARAARVQKRLHDKVAVKEKAKAGSSLQRIESPPPALPESEEEAEPVEEGEEGEEGGSLQGSDQEYQQDDDEDDDDDDDDDQDDDDDDDEPLSEEEEPRVRDQVDVVPIGTQQPAMESVQAGDFTEKQLLVQIYGAIMKLCGLMATPPPSATEVTKKVVAKVSDDSAFKLTPRKKSLGVHRKKAFKAVLKVVWREIAKKSVSIPMYMVIGPIMEALDVTIGPEYDGSITTAFTGQMKTAVAALLREARSFLVGAAFESMLQAAGLPERVEAKYVEMCAARMAVHVREFGKLMAAPPPYDIADHPLYYAFCAYIEDNELFVFGDMWDAIVNQFLLRLPKGSRKLTLWNLSFLFGSIVARLTFVNKDGALVYGKLDEKIWTQAKFENIQRWLMNADECRTTWAPLLKIRRENANYRIGAHDGDSPTLDPSQGLDICGNLVEDVFNATKCIGVSLPLDATEPRLLPTLNDMGPEDNMAVLLSHVPAFVRYGI